MSKILHVSPITDNPLIKVIRKHIYNSKQSIKNAEKYLLKDEKRQLDLLGTAEDLFLEICSLDDGRSLRYYEWVNKLEKMSSEESSYSSKFWINLKLAFSNPPMISIYFRDLDNICRVLLPKVSEEKLSEYASPDYRFQVLKEQKSEIITSQIPGKSPKYYDEFDISLPEGDTKNLEEDNYLRRKFHDTLILFVKSGLIDYFMFPYPIPTECTKRFFPDSVTSFHLTNVGINFFKEILGRRKINSVEVERKK